MNNWAKLVMVVGALHCVAALGLFYAAIWGPDAYQDRFVGTAFLAIFVGIISFPVAGMLAEGQ